MMEGVGNIENSGIRRVQSVNKAERPVSARKIRWGVNEKKDRESETAAEQERQKSAASVIRQKKEEEKKAPPPESLGENLDLFA